MINWGAVGLLLVLASPSPAAVHGLLVGVERFADPSFPALRAPANDLALWADVLAMCGATGPRCVVLRNEQATKSAVLAALDDLAGAARAASDTAVVVFSTHGTRIADALSGGGLQRGDERASLDDQALVMYDSRRGDPHSFLVDDFLATALARFTCRVVLVADSCYADGVERSVPEPAIGRWPTTRGRPPVVLAAACGSTTKTRELVRVPTTPPVPVAVSPLALGVWRTVAAAQRWPTFEQVHAGAAALHQALALPWQPRLYGLSGAAQTSFLGAGKPSGAAGSVTLQTGSEARAVPRAALLQPVQAAAPTGPARAETGRRLAVIIATGRYDDPGIPPLAGAVNDARLLDQVLGQNGWERIVLVPDGPEPLRPTRANLVRALQEFGVVTGEPETLLVHFAGHGVQAPDGEPCLLPSDARLADLPASGLTMKTLATLLGNVRAKHRVLLVDCCKQTASDAAKGFVTALRDSAGDWLVVTAAEAGRDALEIAGHEEPPLGDGEAWRQPHGLFTLCLLEARRQAPADRNNNQQLSLYEAFAAARQRMAEVCAVRGWPVQVPRMFGEIDAADAVQLAQMVGEPPRPPDPPRDANRLLLTSFTGRVPQPPASGWGAFYPPGKGFAGDEVVLDADDQRNEVLKLTYSVEKPDWFAGCWLKWAVEGFDPRSWEAVTFLLRGEPQGYPEQLKVELKCGTNDYGWRVAYVTTRKIAEGWTLCRVPLRDFFVQGGYGDAAEFEFVLTLESRVVGPHKKGTLYLDEIAFERAATGQE